jgi:hypothetical protein
MQWMRIMDVVLALRNLLHPVSALFSAPFDAVFKSLYTGDAHVT